MSYIYYQMRFLKNMYNEPIDPQNETSPSEKCVVCMAQASLAEKHVVGWHFTESLIHPFCIRLPLT